LGVLAGIESESLQFAPLAITSHKHSEAQWKIDRKYGKLLSDLVSDCLVSFKTSNYKSK